MKLPSIRNCLSSIDIFQTSVPTFNIRGKTKISSPTGSIFSIILPLVVLFYGANKLKDLMERRNPTISSFIEEGGVTKNDRRKLNDIGIRFAFGIEGHMDKQFKDDPAYVKWLVR